MTTLKKTIHYPRLSEKTVNQVRNCFKNCNNRDISDHLFEVFYMASERGEFPKNDIHYLVVAGLNSFINGKNILA